MNNPTLFDSTLLLMSDKIGMRDEVAVQIQKSSQTLAPFYKPMQTLGIDEARTRKSERSFGKLCLPDLAELLHLSLFHTDREGRRPYPAAGGIYTVSMYLAALDVDGLPSGVHFVRWSDTSLEQIDAQDAAHRFVQENVFQPNKEQIPLVALLVANTRLSQYKYHDIATRMAYIEAGALLQTMHLAATKLGLPICALSGISDRAALRLTKQEPATEIIFACGVAIGGKVTEVAAGQSSAAT